MGRLPLLQGTLDLLILQTLVWGKSHGHGLAKTIEHRSGDVLYIDHGSLYPALHRLLKEGWIDWEWGQTENNRKAKYYVLTESGRQQLSHEANRWEAMVRAMNQALTSPEDV